MNSTYELPFKIDQEYALLNEVADKMGDEGDLYAGYRALKGVVHTIRDLLLLEEVFQLSSQLPPVIRGIYFEDYNPGQIPVMMYNRELLDQFRKRMGPRNSDYFEQFLNENSPGRIDEDQFFNTIQEKTGFEDRLMAEEAFHAVIDVLRSKLSPPELYQIKNLIQDDVSRLIA